MTSIHHAEVEAREAVDELVESHQRHDGGAGAINALDELREYIADCISFLQAEEAVRQARVRLDEWRTP